MNATKRVHNISIVVTNKPRIISVDGFEPNFNGSDKQKRWATEIAKQAMNQLAALVVADLRKSKRISDGLSWTPEDVEIIKEHAGNAVALAATAIEHRQYAGFWIKNRMYGAALFKMAWG